jgi:uncharacterized protein YggU (UPF0235/DUF167 family)
MPQQILQTTRTNRKVINILHKRNHISQLTIDLIKGNRNTHIAFPVSNILSRSLIAHETAL